MAASPSFDLQDGRWLAHRYVEADDAVQFRWFDREDHRRITFLSPEEVGDAPVHSVAREQCMAVAGAGASPPPRLILHSAFCCSTMLTRAFDLPGTAMGLSEPMILNDVAGMALRRRDGRIIAAAMDAALALLARPLSSGEAVAVKPSNLANPLAPLMLALRPEMRVLLLHAPLPIFLGSVARKEVEGRLWVRELGWKLISLGLAARFGMSEEELFRLTDLQLAGLCWVAQQALFADLVSRHPERVATLNSERMLTDPEQAVAALGRHFNIELDATAITSGPAFQRHSKDGKAFDAKARLAEQETGARRHARELEIVGLWARQLAERFGVPLDLAGSLTP